MRGMPLTLSGLSAVASQYVLPAAVSRIMNQVHTPQFQFLYRQEDVANWLVEEIAKERGEVPEELTYETTEEAQCQICKTSIVVSTAKRCLKCSAPYHEDCYLFIGSCAIFGCGSRS